MADGWLFPPPSLSFFFFSLVLGTSRYLTSYAMYMYMYILYTVDARYMPGIYITKLRYYLPYLTFSPPPSRERMKNQVGISFWVPTSEGIFFGPGGLEFCFNWDLVLVWKYIMFLSPPSFSPFPLPLSPSLSLSCDILCLLLIARHLHLLSSIVKAHMLFCMRVSLLNLTSLSLVLLIVALQGRA